MNWSYFHLISIKVFFRLGISGYFEKESEFNNADQPILAPFYKPGYPQTSTIK